MANTATESQASGHAEVPRPPRFVTVSGHLINVEEVVFARDQTASNTLVDGGPGCYVEFRRKGSLFIPGLTVEGLATLIAGNPF